MSFITVVLIGISLSMDAFSLALAYGLSGINKTKKLIQSVVVGLYHFFMPLIGLYFGNIINKINIISIDLIASLILIYLGLELILSNKKEEINIKNNIIGYLIFGLSVSIDSLTVGIGLKAITNSYILTSITFMLISATFTYLGLILGNIIGKKIGKYSEIIGGLVLIILAIIIFIK